MSASRRRSRTGQKTELGIRPEFMASAARACRLTIRKVEDIGRQKIVRATWPGRPSPSS
jgi:glycerol transport system ATP-binding protein